MINLAEITLLYINVTFQEELKKLIYSSFTLLEKFGLKFYEDKYIDLISRNDSIDRDNKRDNFLFMLKDDLNKVIKEHDIELNVDMDLTLNDLNEVCNFLYIVQNLEDYSVVSYIVNSSTSERNKLINLLEKYTLLPLSRIYEIVGTVSESIIQSLSEFANDKQKDEIETLDKTRLKYIDTFFKFINNTECLGLSLYKDGYTNLTLNELNNIVTFELSSKIEQSILSNSAQAALDVLSILVITKDDFNIPMFKFNKHNSIFTTKLENVTKLTNIMLNIINDFNSFLEATKEKEKLDAN